MNNSDKVMQQVAKKYGFTTDNSAKIRRLYKQQNSKDWRVDFVGYCAIRKMIIYLNQISAEVDDDIPDIIDALEGSIDQRRAIAYEVSATLVSHNKRVGLMSQLRKIAYNETRFFEHLAQYLIHWAGARAVAQLQGEITQEEVRKCADWLEAFCDGVGVSCTDPLKACLDGGTEHDDLLRATACIMILIDVVNEQGLDVNIIDIIERSGLKRLGFDFYDGDSFIAQISRESLNFIYNFALGERNELLSRA